METFIGVQPNTTERQMTMNKDIEPIRIDEMGIEVCIVCECAVENNTCLCDMRGWQYD